MTTNHLLDAMGLLDDDLVQEAEGYAALRRQKHHGIWMAWAASFAVVLVLGYGLTHLNLGMGGGAANGGGNNQTAASAPSAPSGGGAMNGGSTEAGDSDTVGGDGLPAAQEPMSPAPSEGTGDLAIIIGDVVYRSTGETIPLFPDGDDIRYDLSWYEEESGEVNSDPGLCCVMLEDGSVAVAWDFQSQGWTIFAPDPPSEP